MPTIRIAEDIDEIGTIGAAAHDLAHLDGLADSGKAVKAPRRAFWDLPIILVIVGVPLLLNVMSAVVGQLRYDPAPAAAAERVVQPDPITIEVGASGVVVRSRSTSSQATPASAVSRSKVHRVPATERATGHAAAGSAPATDPSE